MKVIDYIKQFEDPLMVFLPGVHRQRLYNFDAYKLSLEVPLLKIANKITSRDEKNVCLAWASEDSNNTLKYILNVTTVYIAGETDYRTFQNEKKIEKDKWLYKSGSLQLFITDPVYFDRTLIQESKCWLTSSTFYLPNYVKKVDSNLADKYFNGK